MSDDAQSASAHRNATKRAPSEFITHDPDQPLTSRIAEIARLHTNEMQPGARARHFHQHLPPRVSESVDPEDVRRARDRLVSLGVLRTHEANGRTYYRLAPDPEEDDA